jgi:glutathione S-transferase
MNLYSHPLSNNGYKVSLLLSFLGQNSDLANVDLVNDAQKTVEFLAMHPLGQIPVLVDGDVTIWDSQAILVYLARRFENEDWLPLTAAAIAEVNSWLSFAAKELQIGLAASRAHHLFAGKDVKFIARLKIDIEKATAIAKNSLEALDRHLSDRQWLVGDAPTIADIACFPPVALAGDGRIAIEPYPHVQAWVNCFRQLPKFIEL